MFWYCRFSGTASDICSILSNHENYMQIAFSSFLWLRISVKKYSTSYIFQRCVIQLHPIQILSLVVFCNLTFFINVWSNTGLWRNGGLFFFSYFNKPVIWHYIDGSVSNVRSRLMVRKTSESFWLLSLIVLRYSRSKNFLSDCFSWRQSDIWS